MDTAAVQDKTAEPAPAAQIALAADTLFGDIRDWLVEQLISTKKPWDKLSEYEQRTRIEAAGRATRELVRDAVKLIASRGFTGLDVSLGKFGVNEGILKADFSCPATNPNLLAINGLGTAVLVLASPLAFLGERKELKPEPDQREMKLDTGETVDAETGEILKRAPAGEGLSPEEFQRNLEKANAKVAEKASRRGKRKTKEPEPEPDINARDVAFARGRDAFLARQPGIVPDDLAGKPEQDAFLAGWDHESVAAARQQDGAPAMPAAPAREPVDA